MKRRLLLGAFAGSICVLSCMAAWVSARPAVAGWRDCGLGDFALHYVRDKEKREVDFLITDKGRPVVLIEAKLSDEKPSDALLHFRALLGGIPAIQVIRRPGVDRVGRGFRVVSAGRFLAGLL